MERDMEEIVALIDEVLASCAKHIDALSVKKGEPLTAAQQASLQEHTAVLEDVKHRVHQMTAGVPLNKY